MKSSKKLNFLNPLSRPYNKIFMSLSHRLRHPLDFVACGFNNVGKPVNTRVSANIYENFLEHF